MHCFINLEMDNQPISLFNKPKSKYINAYDINENSVKIKADEFRFRLSVYGILIHEGKVLLQHNPIIDKLGIPGGGVEIDEFMEDALKREFYEETKIRIKIVTQIKVVENFFSYNNEAAHAVLAYYLVESKSRQLERKNINFHDSDYTKLIPIDELKKHNIVKIFQSFFDTTDLSNY